MIYRLTPGFFILVLNAMAVTADDPPPFKVTTRRADDRVDVKVEKGKATVSIQSPFGISQSMIERTGETWPDTIVLRLHLKGLEGFKITNGKVKLEGATSFQTGMPLVRLWMDGKEDAPLDVKSPHWIAVRIIGDDGKPAKELPLKGGFFELPLSRTLFEGNPKTITVSWIDFYRS